MAKHPLSLFRCLHRPVDRVAPLAQRAHKHKDLATLALPLNAAGLSSGHQFNAAGQQVAIIDRNANTTSSAWNASNELTSITDLNGQTVTLSYNASGYLTAAVDPANRSLTPGYNSANQLTTLTDPNGTPWNYTYTAANQLTSVGDPITFGFSSGGMVDRISFPTGGVDAVAPVQGQGLGAAGQGGPGAPIAPVPLVGTAAGVTDANGNRTQTFVDGLGLGLAQQILSPAGATKLTNRDANGLPWLDADALGDAVRSFFDALGCVIGFT